MKFEIVNPSDPYTMEAPSLELAAVAVCFLGNGKYPLTGLDDARGQDVPPFLFGGHDEWFTEKFGANFEAVCKRAIQEQNEALALTLESVTLTSSRRSSMNDIGGRAKKLAQAVRMEAKESA